MKRDVVFQSDHAESKTLLKFANLIPAILLIIAMGLCTNTLRAQADELESESDHETQIVADGSTDADSSGDMAPTTERGQDEQKDAIQTEDDPSAIPTANELESPDARNAQLETPETQTVETLKPESDDAIFKIIFEKNGGKSNIDEMEAVYGSGQILPGASITKTGNTLAGWSLTSNGAGKTYGANASIDDVVDRYGSRFSSGSTITLKAMWELNSYRVTFYDYNGSLLAEQMVDYGGDAYYYEAYSSYTDDYPSYDDDKCQYNSAYDFLPSDYGPTRNGYAFAGWDKSTESITSETKLTAQYLSISEADKVDKVYSAINDYFYSYNGHLSYDDESGESTSLNSASGRSLYGTATATQITKILKSYNALAKDSRKYCDADDIKALQKAQTRIDEFAAAQKRDLAVGKNYTIDGVQYRILTSKIGQGGTVCATAPAKKSVKRITIPNGIKVSGTTLSVTEVSSKAFAKCSKLQTLEVGSKVKKIGANALYGTNALTKLVFKGNPTNISFAKKALNKVGKKGGGLKVTIPKLGAKHVTKLHKAGLPKSAAVNGYKFTKVKVSFSANGGKIKGSKTKKVVNLKKYGKLPAASRTGYQFKGWYTKKKGGTKVKASSIVKLKKSTKLYAHWFGPKGHDRRISKAEYNRIEYDMTYAQVKYLIGGACHDSYSYTEQEYIEDSHEEWVDTSYETWVYDEYDTDDYGHYETVEDGYWETIDDSYYEDHDIDVRTWYGNNSGYAVLTFRDGRLYDIEEHRL